MKKRGMMLGVGGMAGMWRREFWPAFAERAQIVALVDVDETALHAAGDEAGLAPSARFTSTREAMEKVEADFCCIVTPPAFHQEAVEMACARGLAVLSEKPIADSWESCCAIYRAVRRSGVKMMVTQNYRFTPRILTLKKAIAQLGAVNYVAARYAADYRVRNSCGKFRHEMAHPLLVECSIHHFDQLRNLCDADVKSIAGYGWNPGAARGEYSRYAGSDSFDGQPCGLFVLEMSGGSFASYEGNNLASGRQHSWHQEYYRVECEGGAALLDGDDRVTIEERGAGGETKTREMALEAPQYEGHAAIIDQFLDWLDGGAAPATDLRDNIRSNAALFSAIEASTRREVVDVREMLRESLGEV